MVQIKWPCVSTDEDGKTRDIPINTGVHNMAYKSNVTSTTKSVSVLIFAPAIAANMYPMIQIQLDNISSQGAF